MKYNQTLLVLILVLITFNFVLPIYGNSKQQCKKCLVKCCSNNYKSRNQLETCNDNCKLEHCDGVKINFKDYECPPKPTSSTHKPGPRPEEPESEPEPKSKTPEPIPSTTPDPATPDQTSIPVQPTQPVPEQSSQPIPVSPTQPAPVPPTQPITPIIPTQYTPAPPIQPQTNPSRPVPPFPPQKVHTCTTPDDPACFPPGS